MSFYDGFPKPIGSYTVGRTQIDFKYTASDRSERELTAFFFYPSDDSEHKPTAEYAFPEFHAFRNELLAKIGAATEQSFIDGFKTECYDDLALSEREKRYPVLFYNHGAGAFPQQGTLFCQDLASVGYIVATVGHPGSGVQKLKDGRVVALTKDFLDGLAEYGKESVALYMQTPQILSEKLPEEKAIEISRRLTAAPEAVKFAKFADFQSEDVRYIADCLYKMDAGDIESMFQGRLRLDIGMGVFGHSFGGTTAAIICRDDERFACGVNFDGGMLGCLDSDIKKPFMHLCTALAYNTNAFLLETNSEENDFAIIDNVHHYEFSDFLFTNRSEGFRGTRDPMEVRDIIISYTKAFFDRRLLKKATEFENLAFDGVEMIRRSRKP